MATRFVVTKMCLIEDERVPRVSMYSGNYRVWSNDESDLCVCQAAFESLEGMLADAESVVIDQLPLGVSWGSVPQARRNQLTPAIKALGFVDFDPRTTDSVKTVIESLVHFVRPGVNIEIGGVPDPWG